MSQAAAAGVLPNFLIVGAAKSGTTSLYEYLRTHPDVFMPARKEPTYFADPAAGGITDWEEYCALFAGAGGRKAIGEASVAYLSDPQAAGRIRTALGPEVRIVAILRNPVDMAYSLWGHYVREGMERLSFEQALDEEEERLSNEAFGATCGCWVQNLAYRRRATYSAQLAPYYRTFARENIRVYMFEEFFRDGAAHFADLCGFLGISGEHLPDFRPHNVAGTVRSHWLQRVYWEPMVWKDFLKPVLLPGVRRWAKSLVYAVNRVDRPLPAIDDHLKRTLQRSFAADVRRLEQLIGRDLSAIWF